MGLFSRKNKKEEQVVEPVQKIEKTADLKDKLKAIKEVGRFSIEQKNKLQEEEADTIRGIETISAGTLDAPVYDLMGNKVKVLTKGRVYIQNGKKFVVK